MDETGALVNFLNGLEEILATVADEPKALVPEDLSDRAQRAWPHVRPLFASARDEVVALQGSDAFEQAGLTGDQLEFKIGGFELSRDRFRASRSARALASVLRWADNILKSLPIPGPIKEPIEEYKSAVESAAEDVANRTAK